MYEEQLIKIWAQKNKFRVVLDNKEKDVAMSFTNDKGRDLYIQCGMLPMKPMVSVKKPETPEEPSVSLEALSEKFLRLYGGETLYYYTSNGKAVRAACVPYISPVPYDYSKQIKHE